MIIFRGDTDRLELMTSARRFTPELLIAVDPLLHLSIFFTQPVPAYILFPGYVAGNTSTTSPLLIIPCPMTMASFIQPVDFYSGPIVILIITSGAIV